MEELRENSGMKDKVMMIVVMVIMVKVPGNGALGTLIKGKKMVE